MTERRSPLSGGTAVVRHVKNLSSGLVHTALDLGPSDLYESLRYVETACGNTGYLPEPGAPQRHARFVEVPASHPASCKGCRSAQREGRKAIGVDDPTVDLTCQGCGDLTDDCGPLNVGGYCRTCVAEFESDAAHEAAELDRQGVIMGDDRGTR